MHICLFQSGVSYMRKLKAIVLAGILSVTCAFSVSAASGYVQIVGNTAYDSNGNSYTTVGNTTYSSDGTSYTQVGNYVYGSRRFIHDHRQYDLRQQWRILSGGRQ